MKKAAQRAAFQVDGGRCVTHGGGDQASFSLMRADLPERLRR